MTAMNLVTATPMPRVNAHQRAKAFPAGYCKMWPEVSAQ